MRKKYVLICISVILFSLYGIFILGSIHKHQPFIGSQNEILADELFTASIQQVDWKDLSCQEREFLLERLIMINYVPQIEEAVDKYYKELRGFDIIKITDVKVVAPYEYEMKVQISTYIGAHNPPYGSDVVTIHFKHLRDGKVVNFEHRDE